MMFMLDIKKMRLKTGLSQSEFAKLYDIPVKTLQQWEQGSHKPPQYVLTLLNKALFYDGYYKNNTYLCDIIMGYNEPFVFFRSNIQHLIKYNKVKAMKSILSTKVIPYLFDKEEYDKCLYLLSCFDTLCLEMNLPLCSDYDEYRQKKLKEPLVLYSDDNCLPEFVKHNIYERSITDVY